MTAIQQPLLDAAEVFVDLVLGDDEWMRAEFDALIADCWESPSEPPRGKLCPPAGGWAAGPPSRWPRRPGRPVRPTVSTSRPQGRGRGPPGRVA
ncbi:hypothetical protein ACXC9Q_30495 [Kribbella sp. CWNU-51]